MIRLLNNFNLTNYNTFGIATAAKRFFEFTESDELLIFLQREKLPANYLIMGGKKYGERIILLKNRILIRL